MLISTTTGICSKVLRQPEMYYTCEQSLTAIAEAGYQGVDMCFVAYGREGQPMARPDWRDWVKKQRDLALSLGLVINQGHAHYYKYNPADFEENEAKVVRDIEAAGICHVPWLVVHPNSYQDGGWFSRKLSLQKERERMMRLGELASKYGVGLAIENMIDNKPLRRFAGSWEDLMELLDLLGDDELFGICWDTGHANLCQIDQPEAIRRMGPRLRALHVNDNFGQKDDHTIPFCGNVQWEPIMKALKESGYSGDFTYETHHFTDGFDPGFHHQAMRFARELAEYLLTLA